MISNPHEMPNSYMGSESSSITDEELEKIPGVTKPEAYPERYKITDYIEDKTDLSVADRGDVPWTSEVMQGLYDNGSMDSELVEEYIDFYCDRGLLGKKCEFVLFEGKDVLEKLDKIKGPTSAPDYEGTDTLRGKFGLPETWDREVVVNGENYTLSLNAFHSP